MCVCVYIYVLYVHVCVCVCVCVRVCVQVTYNVMGFMEKNRDSLHTDLKAAVLRSSNRFVVKLLTPPQIPKVCVCCVCVCVCVCMSRQRFEV